MSGHDRGEIFSVGNAGSAENLTLSTILQNNEKPNWQAMMKSEQGGLHFVNIDNLGERAVASSYSPEQCIANYGFLKHPIETRNYAGIAQVKAPEVTSNLPQIILKAFFA